MDESDLSVLRERAEGGDQDAVDQLIELAGEQCNLEELRRLADQGNTTASEMLAELDSSRSISPAVGIHFSARPGSSTTSHDTTSHKS